MNAAITLARVYNDLKIRIKSGEFAPNDRLDPSILARDLNSSTTPVREALHRLAGERLVANFTHEGFRMPLISEAALRDLYGWSSALAGIALRGMDSLGTINPDDGEQTYEGDVRAYFEAVSRGTPNHEIWVAVDNLNDRMHLIRKIERDVIEGALDDRDQLFNAAHSSVTEVRRAMSRFHKKRIAAIPAIAASLRPRDERY